MNAAVLVVALAINSAQRQRDEAEMVRKAAGASEVSIFYQNRGKDFFPTFPDIGIRFGGGSGDQ